MTNRQKWTALALAAIAVVLLVALPDRSAPLYRQANGNIFGTLYHITYQSTQQLDDSILNALHQVDACLSMFNDTSTLSRINRGEDVQLDAMTERLLKEAYQISTLSAGAFDITVAPLVELWGFGRKIGQTYTPRNEEIDSILSIVGYTHIRVVNHQVIKDDSRITLDASAIAKGLGCDEVANVFERNGIENYLVEIGGEVIGKGKNEQGNSWRIGITKPEDNAQQNLLQDIVEADDIRLATSGNYRQFYVQDGHRRSHTIDPRNGYPVEHTLLSATVIAGTCMRADALATACMVLGKDDALKMIAQLDDAACLLIFSQGDSIYSCTSEKWPLLGKTKKK